MVSFLTNSRSGDSKCFVTSRNSSIIASRNKSVDTSPNFIFNARLIEKRKYLI